MDRSQQHDDLADLLQRFESTDKNSRKELVVRINAYGPEAVERIVDRLSDIVLWQCGESDLCEYFELCGESVYLPVMRLLSTGDIETKGACLTALGAIGPITIPVLMQYLQSNDETLRKSAGWALVRLGRESVDPLVQALEDRNSRVRGEAALILGGIAQNHHSPLFLQNAIPPLLCALKDRNAHVRKNVASALGVIKFPEGILPLIEAANDRVEFVRSAAVAALAGYDDSRVVDPLLEALCDEKWQIRSSAVRGLYRFCKDSSEVVGSLLASLSVEDHPKVREELVWRLCHVCEDDPETVLDLFVQRGEDVREGAAFIFAERPYGEAFQPLVDALSDDWPWVRMYSARALGSLHDKRAIKLLIAVLRDPEEAVVDEVITALELLARDLD